MHGGVLIGTFFLYEPATAGFNNQERFAARRLEVTSEIVLVKLDGCMCAVGEIHGYLAYLYSDVFWPADAVCASCHP